MQLNTGSVGLNPLLVLAIERALSPPIMHRRSSLQPMRVIVVEPGFPSAHDGLDQAGFDVSRILLQAVTQAAGMSGLGQSNFEQRTVRGEILSDENGQLYEKLGSHVRLIQQLASSPYGDVIELVPTGQRHLRMIAPVTEPKFVESNEPGKSGHARKESVINLDRQRFVPFGHSQEKPGALGHRKLFPDPGQWRVVRWSDFKEILSQQLANPHRLSDQYRLPCYVQVIETDRVLSVDELARTYSSENERNKKLYHLTDEIAAKLDLISMLPPRSLQQLDIDRPPNTLLPHERLFSLLVANDPTVDVASPNKTAGTATASASATSESLSKATSAKDSIPADFLKEWEFKISRAEAAYDMKARPSLGSAIRNIFRRLRVFRLRREVRKWQVLMSGKNADEQLWVVRPPTEMPAPAFVREWAVKTLELAGYDSQKMIFEWEIFWRRKG
ncbi:MAG TPA: hypothetical protein VGD61_15380 [Pyrinomonadaceae bacterium]